MQLKKRLVLGGGIVAGLLLAFQNCARANFGQDLASLAAYDAAAAGPAQGGGSSDPGAGNPAPSNPAPSNPAPSNPAPSNPAPSNPAPSNPAPSNPAPPQAICNPFGSSGGQTGHGLTGQLFFQDALQSASLGSVKTLGSIYNGAHWAQLPMFLNDLNVTTRPGLSGFNAGGQLVADPITGQPVTQNFGLHLTTNLSLPLTSERPPGLYQFALISDDGGQVWANGLNMYIAGMGSNPNAQQGETGHGTKAECGATAIQLTRGDVIPLDIYYWQGNQGQLAASLVWRYANSIPNPDYQNNGCGGEPEDGSFYNAGGGWDKMVGQGWHAVENQYLFLPAGAVNPCQ